MRSREGDKRGVGRVINEEWEGDKRGVRRVINEE